LPNAFLVLALPAPPRLIAVFTDGSHATTMGVAVVTTPHAR
jgi:hypothetical protein